jgi:hypothetical protein
MNERDDDRDQSILALGILRSHAPDAGRAAQIRVRARTMLRARATRELARARVAPGRGWRAAFEPLLVAAVCAVFLFEVIVRATRLYRF